MNLINDILKDYRNVMDQAAEPSRTYNKTSSHKYKPEQARYKLVVWFKDGNRRIFHSYDTAVFNKEKHLDEHTSLVKLVKLIKKYQNMPDVGNTVHNAIIYATLDVDRKITSDYCYQVYFTNIGEKDFQNNAVDFLVKGKDNVLNLEKLKLYSNKKLNRN